MYKWLVIFESGLRRIYEADDLNDLTAELGDNYVIAVVRMDADG